MDEELLITLVKERGELFDTQHKYYEDNARRDLAWQEIAKRLHLPAHECRDRWKRLRDNYRRARKLRLIKKAQGVKQLKAIKHESVLSFMDPIIDYNCNDTTDEVKDQDDETLEYESTSSITERQEELVHIEAMPMQNYEKPKNDTIVNFFANLGETVKTFPEDVQIRVKRDIFNVISEAEEEVYRSKRNKYDYNDY